MIYIDILALLMMVVYAGIMLYSFGGFISIRSFKAIHEKENKTKVCIVISARNEEAKLPKCLHSLNGQEIDPSLVELIIIDDGSEDSTGGVAEKILQASRFKYKILVNAGQEGKKASITKAIAACSSELIITRDADTYTCSEYWLKNIVAFYETTGKKFIIAPVLIDNRKGIWQQLQRFEGLALAEITAGFAGHNNTFLCSGANLAFTKELFNKVKGYASHAHLPSGDDVLLMEDVKKAEPGAVGYLKQKEALVYTYPEKDLGAIIDQRTRWAAKFKSNPNRVNFTVGFVVFLCHVFSLFYLLTPLFTLHLPLFGLIFICARVLIDFLLLFLASRYYGNPLQWLWFIPLSLLYSFYAVTIAFASLAVKPKWKKIVLQKETY